MQEFRYVLEICGCYQLVVVFYELVYVFGDVVGYVVVVDDGDCLIDLILLVEVC